MLDTNTENFQVDQNTNASENNVLSYLLNNKEKYGFENIKEIELKFVVRSILKNLAYSRVANFEKWKKIDELATIANLRINMTLGQVWKIAVQMYPAIDNFSPEIKRTAVYEAYSIASENVLKSDRRNLSTVFNNSITGILAEYDFCNLLGINRDSSGDIFRYWDVMYNNLKFEIKLLRKYDIDNKNILKVNTTQHKDASKKINQENWDFMIIYIINNDKYEIAGAINNANYKLYAKGFTNNYNTTEIQIDRKYVQPVYLGEKMIFYYSNPNNFTDWDSFKDNKLIL